MVRSGHPCQLDQESLIDSPTSFRRQNATYQGGVLLDGGVHYVAAIRYLLDAAGQSITKVAAFTSRLHQLLAPLDTVHSTMQISNGNSGTFSLSFGTVFKREFEFQVVTDKGTVTVTSDAVVLSQNDFSGSKAGKKHSFTYLNNGIQHEFATFARAIHTGKMEPRATPEEALLDLKVVQAMLESGADGGMAKSV